MKAIQQGLPLIYNITFPITRPIPQLTEIKFNNEQYCTGQRVISPVVTNLYLEHFLYPPGVNPLLNNLKPEIPPTTEISKFLPINLSIGNGEKISPGQWPWLVAIFVIKKIFEFQCAGSLITDRHVLTVAHCRLSDGQNIPVNNFIVSVGRYNLNNWREKNQQNSEVKEIYVHPEYKIYNSAHGDLALFILRDKVKMNSIIQPLCLWSGPTNLEMVVHHPGYVVGWGRDERGNQYSTEPRVIQVPIVSQEDCLRSNSAFISSTSNKTFCAGRLDGSGPCNGDSGSAFVIFNPLSGKYYLRGVVSLSLLDRETLSCDSMQYVVYVDAAKDVKEALQTIGKFLKEGGGPNWLSGLVTKQASPLTTEQLVKEIVNSTVATENVKQAANILKAALDEQKQAGANSTQLFEFDGWKDLIDNIEEQNDIVCLYRKSSNVSNERSQDWEKFLKNISPEYTIYFALEMGQKYVICLKKINVPERNNSDNTNATVFNASDLPRINSSIIYDNAGGGNGSRSLNHVDKDLYNDNDKCDSPEMENIHNQRNMPAKPNYIQRASPMMPMAYPTNSDSPCNRPIILMLPPNYVPPNNYNPSMGGGLPPVWPQMTPPNPLRPPLMQYYPPNINPNARPTPPSMPYSNPADIFRRVQGHGRKRLPVTPRPIHPTESQDDRNRVKPNSYAYGKNVLVNSPEKPPGQILRGVKLHPPPSPAAAGGATPGASSPRYVLQTPQIAPLSRSLSPPWMNQFDQGFRQPNLIFNPYPMASQLGLFRPQNFYNYQFTTTPSSNSPPSSHGSSSNSPNCITCESLCDRPILVKVLVENPTNQHVKLHAPSIESLTGRRQISEQTVENNKDNLNENYGESTVGNVDKEIG
ncbi:hypothetical protein PV327_006417 [Microctonus hyperodae]|nr:hypothetical protein PV327_006417 [Microctonus hyperodae]